MKYGAVKICLGKTLFEPTHERQTKKIIIINRHLIWNDSIALFLLNVHQFETKCWKRWNNHQISKKCYELLKFIRMKRVCAGITEKDLKIQPTPFKPWLINSSMNFMQLSWIKVSKTGVKATKAQGAKQVCAKSFSVFFSSLSRVIRPLPKNQVTNWYKK